MLEINFDNTTLIIQLHLTLSTCSQILYGFRRKLTKVLIDKNRCNAQRIRWSLWPFSQIEAEPLHTGSAEICDWPKCGQVVCNLYVS